VKPGVVGVAEQSMGHLVTTVKAFTTERTGSFEDPRRGSRGKIAGRK
jgi:hypothetical protein